MVRLVDTLIAVLLVGALFLYHWVVRRPLEPHNHVADLGLIDFYVVAVVAWMGWHTWTARDEYGPERSESWRFLVDLGIVLALGYVLFQVDYMLCREAWFPCAGTGPGISGYFAGLVALFVLLALRDALLRSRRDGWRFGSEPMVPVLTVGSAFVALYIVYRLGMPAGARNRLVFDEVLLVLAGLLAVCYGVLGPGRRPHPAPG
jgi:hypothetical protein